MPLLHIFVRSLAGIDAVSFAKDVTMAVAATTLPCCMPYALTSDADRAMVANEIESKAVMPEEVWPLNDYARYYAEAPHGKIIGHYQQGEAKPGQYWVPLEDLANIFDGVRARQYRVRSRNTQAGVCVLQWLGKDANCNQNAIVNVLPLKRATMIESQFGSADFHLERFEKLTLADAA